MCPVVLLERVQVKESQYVEVADISQHKAMAQCPIEQKVILARNEGDMRKEFEDHFKEFHDGQETTPYKLIRILS